MPLMCWHRKTKYSTTIWACRASPSTSTRSRMRRNNPREQATPQWRTPSYSLRINPCCRLSASPKLTKSGRTSASMKSIGPPRRRCTRQLTGRPRSRNKPLEARTNFGAARGKLRQVPQAQQANGLTRLVADLDKYFDSLTAAATTEKGVLEELVKSNAALTTTNVEFFASVASLIKANY